MAARVPDMRPYGAALVAVALATLGSLVLEPVVSRTPFAFYFAAVAVAARYGGLGPGLLAAVLGLLAADTFILLPASERELTSGQNLLSLAVLATVAVVIGSITAQLRAARERARAAERLAAAAGEEERREREWLQTTLASIGDAVVATDARGEITFLNDVAATLLGWGVAEAVGRPLAEVFRIINEETRAAVESPVERVLRDRVMVGLANHTVLIARDGSERPIDDSAAPIKGPDGDLQGVVLVFRDVSARRQAENEVRRARDQLEIIFRQVADGITVQNPDGELIYANDAAARLIGFASAEQFLATPVPEIVGRYAVFDEAGAPLPFEQLPGRRASAGEQAPDVTLRFRVRASGEERWALVTATAALDEQGRVQFAINVFRDITEAKQAELARARLAAIVESSDDAIIGKTLDSIITSWNGGAERLYGYRADEVIGKSVALLVPADRPDELPSIMERLRRGERIDHFDTERITKDGRRLSVALSISPIVGPDGRPSGAATIARDITERRLALERQRFLAAASTELASSLDYEQTLAQVARLVVPTLADWCAIDVLGPDGSIRRLAVAHPDPEKVELAHELERRYPPDPGASRGVPAVLRSGQAEFYPEITDQMLIDGAIDEEQLQIARAVGLKSAMVLPLVARGRTLAAMTLVMAESSRRYGPDDLVQAEELARRCSIAIDNAELYQTAQDAIALRDEFLSIASHELRTPLTVLTGQAQLLRRRLARVGRVDPDDLDRSLESITNQAQRLGQLVLQLLDVSRIQSGQLGIDPGDADLRRLVDRAVESARLRVSQHTMNVHGPAQLPARLDALRMEQVLTNLLDNAIKYSPDGGSVEVTLGQTATELTVSVRDHGLGIPPEQRGRIFDRFFQAHQDAHRSGMGLGLYISKQIVELHAGQITVEFPPGGGTCFVVHLPAVLAGHESDDPDARLGPEQHLLAAPPAPLG